jgi:hypothetical protein
MALIARLRLSLPNIGIFGPAANTIIADEARASMEAAVLLVQREVQTRTPVGATGILRGSIASEVRGTPVQIRGIVATPQSYALPVEEGSRPHWAPIGPLLLWARRVLGDERAAYRVRWAIHLRGTRGAHMFARGLEASRSRVTQLFQQARDRMIRRLGG